ncbi:MAG TPA: hypothetical protein VG328_22595 [Stellaceae bacterium]|jgi:hypothetical protein|nr:hypothetical protein [Stellaceae bacterium]
MDRSNSLPRGRARSGRGVSSAVPALLALGFLTGCVGPGQALRQFGVVGTFAEDCSRSVAQGGARAVYDVPASGDATFTAVNRYGTFRSRIVRADRIGPDTLIMYVDDPGGAWNEIDMRRVDNGFVTTRMVSHKPNEYLPRVAVGNTGASDAATGGQGLFVQRCSE